MKESEIAFVIESASFYEMGGLVISLSHGKKEGFHFQLAASVKEAPIAYWRNLCTSLAEKEALEFLFSEELAYQREKTGKTPLAQSFVFKTIHISPKKVFGAFQCLAPTLKVYCGGKSIVIDLFSQADFYYTGALKEEGFVLGLRLRFKGSDMGLEECLGLGCGYPNHWFIKGVSLKFIASEIPWKRVVELKTGVLLDRAQQKTFLESLEEEDSLEFVMSEGSKEALFQENIPLPVLQLKDRFGASADLLFDYGSSDWIPFHSPLDVIQGVRRQKETEKQFEKDLFETGFLRKVSAHSHYFCPLDKVGKSLCFLLEIGWKVRDVHGNEVVRQTKWHVETEDKGALIALKGKVCFESFEANFSDVALAFNRRDKFVSLSPNKVGLISVDDISSDWQAVLSEGEIGVCEVTLKKNQIGLLASIKGFEKPFPSLEKVQAGWAQVHSEEISLTQFLGSLRPYQVEGVNWLSFLYNCDLHGILADEMGLGKTVQVIAFLSTLKKREAPHLIVVPTSLIFNWRAEIEKFLPSFSCYVHEGGQRKRSSEALKEVDIILTSYGILRQDLPLFQSLAYHCLILDEAQVIKNAHTQTAAAVCSLESNLRLCMTGTPVENHLFELWSHFHFLMPDLLGSEETFQATVQASSADFRHLEKIRKKTAPFILRRKKNQVAKDLPDLVEQTITIEMGEAQRKCYEDLLCQFKGGLMKKVALDGAKAHRLEILEAILRLRQVCCHPLLASSLIDCEGASSAKYEALFSDLEILREEGHKVLIYSQFTSMLQLMTKRAHQNGWEYCTLDGSTQNREEVVKKFQEDASVSFFFMSLKAGGVGLNLTSADYVYLFDPWWNNAAEEQAIGRAHRIGREKTTFAKRLVVRESIEEKMMKLKDAKSSLIQNLFDEEASFVNHSIDDLLALLF